MFSGPFPDVTIQLTPCLTFKYQSRRDMSVTYTHEGIQKVFDVSIRLRRYDNYLEHAVPLLGTGGKLALSGPFKTLVERTHDFNEQMQVRGPQPFVLVEKAVTAPLSCPRPVPLMLQVRAVAD